MMEKADKFKEVSIYKQTDELTKETLDDKYEEYKEYLNKLIERIFVWHNTTDDFHSKAEKGETDE